MKKTKKNPFVEVKDVKAYTATVKVLGRTHEAKGSTISEAISLLKPENCKGKAILTVEHNGNKKERVLMPVVAFRLFNTMGFSKEIALKHASMLFQGI